MIPSNIPVAIYLFLLHGLAFLAIWYCTPLAILFCVGFYFITGFGVTVGYHRLLTHHSFHTSLFLRRLFAVIGALAGQGGPLFWVSMHRLHHLASDQDTDPHDARRGFFWAHMGWFLYSKNPLNPDYDLVSDLTKDPFMRWLDRSDFWLQAVLAGVVSLLVIPFTDSYTAVSLLVWAFPLRIIIVLHSTWLTNSAAHLWGYRRFPTADNSFNNVWVALVTLGEGWHNNHHAFPGSARHGLVWYEFDPSWLLIKILHSFRLVTNVRVSSRSSRLS